MAHRLKKRLMSLVPEHLTSLADATEEYLLSKRAGRRSRVTIAVYEEFLTHFAWWCQRHDCASDVRFIMVTELRHFVEYLQNEECRWDSPAPQARRRLSECSVQHYYALLRAFWNWCQTEGYIEDNPFKDGRLQTPKARKTIIPSYSEQEIRALLVTCQKGEQRLRDYALVLVLLDTGVRAAELCGIRLEDVERGRIRVLGKGNKERYVAMSPQTEKALRDYVRKERRDDEQENVFLGQQGPLTPTGLYQIIRRRAEQADISTRGIHRFRHTFALSFARSGGPLHALQALLGHETAAQSLQYGRMASEEAAELHRQHSPVARLELRKGRGRP